MPIICHIRLRKISCVPETYTVLQSTTQADRIPVRKLSIIAPLSLVPLSSANPAMVMGYICPHYYGFTPLLCNPAVPSVGTGTEAQEGT